MIKNIETTAEFYKLMPDDIMSSIENLGYTLTGEYIQLNSYENRVYDLYLEKSKKYQELQGRLITKFYRPNRWSREALLEEHMFLKDLDESGIPVIAPIELNNKTLFNHNGIYFSLFKKGLGRIPQEFNLQQLRRTGRVLAQLHNVGASKNPVHRLTFDVETYAYKSLDLLENYIAPEVENSYYEWAEIICDYLYDVLDPAKYIRIHGDCHRGNILIQDKKGELEQLFFIDFDDFCFGPPEQDFWMLFSGIDEEETKEELGAILSGYCEFRDFKINDMNIFKALRGLRIIHYSAWIARRLKDPVFQKLFPEFCTYKYWLEENTELEKIARSLS